MGTVAWIAIGIGIILLLVVVGFRGRKTLKAHYRETYASARQIHTAETLAERHSKLLQIIADSLVSAVDFRPDVKRGFIDSLFPANKPLPVPVTNEDIDNILVEDEVEAKAALWALSRKLYAEANRLRKQSHTTQ